LGTREEIKELLSNRETLEQDSNQTGEVEAENLTQWTTDRKST
jgi:hypothetical protein